VVYCATFINISVISLRSVLLVEEIGVPGGIQKGHIPIIVMKVFILSFM
jgi:hypothetical protein